MELCDNAQIFPVQDYLSIRAGWKFEQNGDSNNGYLIIGGRDTLEIEFLPDNEILLKDVLKARIGNIFLEDEVQGRHSVNDLPFPPEGTDTSVSVDMIFKKIN